MYADARNNIIFCKIKKEKKCIIMYSNINSFHYVHNNTIKVKDEKLER